MTDQQAMISGNPSQLEGLGPHVVAECRWDSLFDDENMSFQLQEYLSYFSQTALLRILQKGFDRHIPANQIFRIDTLVLDLGVLQIEDLETQLSNAIETCLSRQLSDSLRWNKPKSSNLDQSNAEHQSNHEQAQLLDSDQSLTGFIQTFLSTGISPWWYRGGFTNKQIFLDQLLKSPNQLASTLRIVGRSESARKRMLWQWKLDGVEKIVSLLEPVHYGDIMGFAEQLSHMHIALGRRGKERLEFRQLMMSWVLTFIMTERGAKFYQAAYIEFLLGKYACQYKLTYSRLLEGIHAQVYDTNADVSFSDSNRDVIMQLQGSRPRINHASETLVGPITRDGQIRKSELGEVDRKLSGLKQALPAAKSSLPISDDSSLESYLQAVMQFLRSGDVMKISGRQILPDIERMFSILLARRPRQLAEMTRQLIAQSNDKVDADEGVAFRLQALTCTENYTLLRSTIAPSIHEFLSTFTSQLMAWHHNGWLPVLNAFDCYQYLQSSILFTLISDFRHGLSIEDFLPSFLNTLNRQYGVDSQRFRGELIQCLTKRSPAGKFDTKISAYLALNETATADLNKYPQLQNTRNLSSTNKSRVLITMLRAPEKHRSDKHYHQLATLTNSMTAYEFESFLLRTARQVDRSTILQSLLTGIGQLPPTRSLALDQQLSLVSDEKLIELFCAAFKSVGHQLGSTSLLKARLIELIRLCEWQNIVDKREPNSLASKAKLIKNLVLASCQEFGVSITDLVDFLNVEDTTKKHIEVGSAIDQLIISESIVEKGKGRSKDKPQAVSNSFFKIDIRGKYLDHPLAEIVFLSLLRDGRLPLWLNRTAHLDVKRFCDDLVEYQPQRLKGLITQLIDNPVAKTRLNNLISYPQLMAAVKQTQGQPYSTLKMLEHFHNGLAHLEIAGLNASVLQTVFLQQTMHCWLEGNWHVMTTNRIAAYFCAGLKETFAIGANVFNAQLNRQKKHFPADMKIQNETTKRLDHEEEPHPALTLDQHKVLVTNKLPDSKPIAQAHPITINNAGLVILQGFMKTYFERLELVENDKFTSPKTQRDAVHHLQYLVTGQYRTEEQHLLLNKILCGIDVPNPIEAGVDVGPENSETANSLIEAMIQYWSAIGSSSIDGFRGNWLVRQGSLTEQADYWHLNVETKPYDLLLQQAPVSFSIIKHPWMPKPINVSWPT